MLPIRYFTNKAFGPKIVMKNPTKIGTKASPLHAATAKTAVVFADRL
jgi:hypothetical protein